MLRDQFFQDIVERLEKKLDHESFEQCAASLLRSVHPGLVPVRGGQDAGMDGAIADNRGSPFPLISTTGNDALGNLRRSLESYVSKGGKRREAVFATSRKLTPGRRRNLEKAAEEKGFTLLQVYDQAAMAEFLHSSPEWCQELLALTGNPPALSSLPRSDRPLVGVPLLGREDDLAWLRAADADSVLIGQPGSGKTFLHYSLAKDGRFLFVVSGNRGEIAQDLRKMNPAGLILDDAHRNLNLLRSLVHMRDEFGATFRILANCWPGEEKEVARILRISETSIRSLELLTRDQIAELVRACGVAHPYWIQEVVEQADGRPGLAVTLSHLLIRGDMQALGLAEALKTDVRATYQPVLGREAMQILACLSVGGDAGMRVRAVGTALGISHSSIYDSLTRLSAGGVVHKIRDDQLAVLPGPLRDALVRDFFFAGPTALPIQELLPAVPDQACSALALIGARLRGADVPDNLILTLEGAKPSFRVASEFAWLGAKEARLMLRRFPEYLTGLACPCLHRNPEDTLPTLLTGAAEQRRSEAQPFDDLLRKVEEWAGSAEPGTGEVKRRRGALLDAAIAWTNAGGDQAIGLEAVRIALAPAFAATEPAPGSGLTFSFRHGLIAMSDVQELEILWPKALSTIGDLGITELKPIADLIDSWAYPGRHSSRPIGEARGRFTEFGRRMLIDVVALPSLGAGMRRLMKETGQHFDESVEIKLDEDFEVLFPLERMDDWRTWQKDCLERVEALSDRWAELEVGEAIPRLLEIERDARAVGLAYPRWSPDLCAFLAQRVASPAEWAAALIESGAQADLVHPFLRKARDAGDPAWEALALKCLGNPELTRMAAGEVLAADGPSRDLADRAIQAVGEEPRWVEIACLRGDLPVPVVRRLLRSSNLRLAGAAAVGEWRSDPANSVRKELASDWRSVIIQGGVREGLNMDYHLKGILQINSDLCFPWLKARLREERFDWRLSKDVVATAASSLSREERGELLRSLNRENALPAFVTPLVGDDPDLYQVLLDNPATSTVHEYPLSGSPTEAWTWKALVASDYGMSAERIAASTRLGTSIIAGPLSAEAQGWIDAFSKLLDHEHPKIQKIARAGVEDATKERDARLRDERLAQVHGIR